jgi:guanine deaminase
VITAHKAKYIFDAPKPQVLRLWENALITFNGSGEIIFIGDAGSARKKFSKIKIKDHGENSVIFPGFVDSHVHAPQLEMMGSAGNTLIDWLYNFTFPTEIKYNNKSHAVKGWKTFVSSQLAHGTTTAAVYATSNSAHSHLLMKEAAQQGLKIFSGPVLMDVRVPKELSPPTEKQIDDTFEFIQKWQGHRTSKPSLVLRFIPSSSKKLLKGAQKITQKYPELIFQSHLAETENEVAWVKNLFPQHKSYTNVFDDYGLLHSGSLLGHGIYLSPNEQKLIQKRQSTIVHCPSSNTFLGSGLMPYEKYRSQKINIALGSDVGAGTTLFMPTIAKNSYEVQALQNKFMKASELLWLSTQAGANALHVSDSCGSFDKGKQADFVVMDYSDLDLDHLSNQAQNENGLLARLLFLSQQNHVKQTVINGQSAYQRDT